MSREHRLRCYSFEPTDEQYSKVLCVCVCSPPYKTHADADQPCVSQQRHSELSEWLSEEVDLGAFEGHVLKEVGTAICSIGLVAAPSIDPDPHRCSFRKGCGLCAHP